MGRVWKRDDWNDIIRQVNELAQNPDAGCDPVEPLEEVEASHRWSKSDIRQVQNKLKEICDENEFDDVPNLWKQRTVDEINEAIARGWCNCDKCQADDEIIVLFSAPLPFIVDGILVWQCGQTQTGCQPPDPICFDWYSAATAITGFGQGVGGGVQVRRVQKIDGEVVESRFLYSNAFDCAGNQRTPLPTRPVNEDGSLKHACISPSYQCFECTATNEAGVKCNLGLPFCGGEQGAALQAAFEQAVAAVAGKTSEVIWIAIKLAPQIFHGQGAPCRECCPDGSGFVGSDCENEGGGLG